MLACKTLNSAIGGAAERGFRSDIDRINKKMRSARESYGDAESHANPSLVKKHRRNNQGEDSTKKEKTIARYWGADS